MGSCPDTDIDPIFLLEPWIGLSLDSHQLTVEETGTTKCCDCFSNKVDGC